MPFQVPNLVSVWTGAYLGVGCLIAGFIWRASAELYCVEWGCDLPWWAKLPFPDFANFRNVLDDCTYGTWFWNRSVSLEWIGFAVIAVLWPLRVSGSLFGWVFILAGDGIAYCFHRGNRGTASRIP